MAYTTLSNLTQDTILTAGTYYFPNRISCIASPDYYSVTFDCTNGPIVIKRSSSVVQLFEYAGELKTINSSETNKVIFTVKDDNTVGEIIDGSTGVPSASGGGIAYYNSYYPRMNSYSQTFEHCEIRWANTSVFFSNKNKLATYRYIEFKNCNWNSQIIFNCRDSCSLFIEHINFDSVNEPNIISGSSILFYCSDAGVAAASHIINNFSHIYATNLNTTNFGAFLRISNNNVLIKNIIIKNVGVPSTEINASLKVYINSNSLGESILNLENINASIETDAYIPYENSIVTFNFKNCLFDNINHINKNYAIYNSASRVNLIFQNCIFKDWQKVFYNYEESNSVHVTYIDVKNSIFMNNGQLLEFDDIGHQTADFNGYYGNDTDNYWSFGEHEVYSNPQFSNTLENCIIDQEFEKIIPDGYFIGNLQDYEQRGYNTFDNLFIDESIYTATGLKYSGTNKITPGINYLVNSFSLQSIWSFFQFG